MVLRMVVRGIAVQAVPLLYLQYKIARGRGIEPELALLPGLCDRHRLAIDVGANIGIYAHALRPLARQVWAFEPNPALCRLLRRTFGLSVRIEQVALSDAPATRDLFVPVHHGRATIETRLPGAASVAVTTRRLDDYDVPPVGFIKIDVEGHEGAVLRGASGVLARDRPNVLVEVEERHREGAVADVRRLLEGLGYAGFFLDGSGLVPIADFDPGVHQDARRAAGLGHAKGYINNFIFRAV
jgi:FkbM family methyltransferase